MKKLGILGILLSIITFTLLNRDGPIDVNIESTTKKVLINSTVVPATNGQIVISKNKEQGCNETIDVYQSNIRDQSKKVRSYCNWSQKFLYESFKNNNINLDGLHGLMQGQGFYIYNKENSDHYFLVDISRYTAYSLQDSSLIIDVFSHTRNDNFDIFGPDDYRTIEQYKLDYPRIEPDTITSFLTYEDKNIKTIFTLVYNELWKQIDPTTWEVYDLNTIKYSPVYPMSIELYSTLLVLSICILIGGFFFSFETLFKTKEQLEIDHIYNGNDLISKFKFFLSNNDKILQLKNKQKFLQEQKEFLGFNLIYLKEFKGTYIEKIRRQVSGSLGTLGTILTVPHSYVFSLVILGLLFQGISYLVFGKVSINMGNYDSDIIVKYWSDICLWILISIIFGYTYIKHLVIINTNIDQLVYVNTQSQIKDSDLSFLINTFTNDVEDTKENVSFIEILKKTGLFLFGQPFILGHGSVFGGFSFPTLIIIDFLIFMIVFNFLQPIISLFFKIEINMIYYLKVLKSKKLRTIIKLDNLLDSLLISLERIKQDVSNSKQGEVVKVYKGIKQSMKLLEQVFKLLKVTSIEEFKHQQFKSLLQQLLLYIFTEMINILTNIKNNITGVAKKYDVDINLEELNQQIVILENYKKITIT